MLKNISNNVSELGSYYQGQRIGFATKWIVSLEIAATHT